MPFSQAVNLALHTFAYSLLISSDLSSNRPLSRETWGVNIYPSLPASILILGHRSLFSRFWTLRPQCFELDTLQHILLSHKFGNRKPIFRYYCMPSQSSSKYQRARSHPSSSMANLDLYIYESPGMDVAIWLGNEEGIVENPLYTSSRFYLDFAPVSKSMFSYCPNLPLLSSGRFRLLPDFHSDFWVAFYHLLVPRSILCPSRLSAFSHQNHGW